MCIVELCAERLCFHDHFPCLLPGFLWSCEADRGCQPWGWEATEIVNKCLWALSSQVITPSHKREHAYTHTLILSWIDYCLPGSQMFHVPRLKEVPPTPRTFAFNLFLLISVKKNHSSFVLSLFQLKRSY